MDTQLGGMIERAVPRLQAISEADAERRPAPGKWSKKEILGHLIDSAANNHQRFVRLQLEEIVQMPSYEQDGWVRVQRYQEASWQELIELWALYNRHLARVILCLDAASLNHTWHGPSGQVSLGFLAHDYLSHLKHHFAQLGIAE